MDYTILPNRNLKIFWDINNYSEIISELEEQDPQWYHRDANLWDFFENLFSDSELQQIEPVEMGALTSSPILGIRDQNDTVIQVWWYPNYAIASPLEELIKDGFTIFESGN
ncbi:MAG: hypothetical protein WBM62_09450 [Crocosphaera sp.]